MKCLFDCIATKISKWTGSLSATIIAILTILIWLVSYPLFKDLNSWMLVINTLTTVVTYIMVFFIQYSQNKDTKAIQLKLDELIKTDEKTNNKLIGAERLTDDEIIALKQANYD